MILYTGTNYDKVYRSLCSHSCLIYLIYVYLLTVLRITKYLNTDANWRSLTL